MKKIILIDYNEKNALMAEKKEMLCKILESKKEIAEADVVGVVTDELDGIVTVFKSRSKLVGSKMPIEVFGIRSVNGTL